MHVPLWSWCCLFAQLGEELELEAVGRMLVVELFAMACCDDWGGERQSRKTRTCKGAAGRGHAQIVHRVAAKHVQKQQQRSAACFYELARRRRQIH